MKFFGVFKPDAYSKMSKTNNITINVTKVNNKIHLWHFLKKRTKCTDVPIYEFYSSLFNYCSFEGESYSG